MSGFGTAPAATISSNVRGETLTQAAAASRCSKRGAKVGGNGASLSMSHPLAQRIQPALLLLTV